MNILIIVLIIIILILVNGLYVAGEFSTVSSRRPRLAQMAEEGSRTAQTMLALVEDPRRVDAYVAACQLGITLSSLMLGVYGQSQLTQILGPQLERFGTQEWAATLSTTIVLIGLTILQVILGELIPKNLGIQFPERLSTMLAPAMIWSMKVFRPLIWLFNGSGQVLLRAIGASPVAEHVHVHSPSEIQMLVKESSAGGLLEKSEEELLINTLKLRHLTARQVMIPRSRMETADARLSSSELLDLLARSPYSRMPLYDGTIDNIIGLVHLRDLLCAVHVEGRNNQASVEKSGESEDRRSEKHELTEQSSHQGDSCGCGHDVMRSVGYVPESLPVEDVLTQMQQQHNSLIIVMDEYGGTSGMITIEDLFEEIIGEFEDEFDPDRAHIRLDGEEFPTEEDRLVVDGDVHINDLNELLGLSLSAESVDTIGGLVFSTLGKLPQVGDTVALEFVTNDLPGIGERQHGEKGAPDSDSAVAKLDVAVERMDGHRIAEVSFPITPEQVDALQEVLEVETDDSAVDGYEIDEVDGTNTDDVDPAEGLQR